MVVIGRSKESRVKSRRFLQAVYDADGRARTSEIRRKSGLSRSDVKYRYETLAEKELITIEYDEEGIAGPNESAQKIAVLTDLARVEIENKGLLQGGHYQPAKDVREVDELATEVNKLTERISVQEREIDELQTYITKTVYKNVSMLQWSVARLEVLLEEEERRLSAVEPGERLEALKERAKRFEVEQSAK